MARFFIESDDMTFDYNNIIVWPDNQLFKYSKPLRTNW